MGPGRIGRFEVIDHLASGGMGQVYLARSTGLGGFERQVVIKTLDPGASYEDDEAFVTMFLDEARLVGALHHQFIAPVYEVGCDDEGRYFLVMDYIQGETAQAIWRASENRGCPIPLGLSLTIGSAVASALHYAHELCAADGTPLEIVHRDVSLSNVMVGHDGSVKLIDFGIAKSARRSTKTQVGTLKGKIGYLAPEQVLQRPIDRRTDIFALGIVMYELTTTRRAFRDPSDLVTFERITSGELARPSEVVDGYPADLERIVMRALATDPARRYQDAGTMGRDLEAFAARIGVSIGHVAVCEGLRQLFKNGRRRLARGSVEDTSDVNALPVVEIPVSDIDETPVEAPAIPESIHDQPTRRLESTDAVSIPVAVPGEHDLTERADMSLNSEIIEAGRDVAPLMVRFRRTVTTERIGQGSEPRPITSLRTIPWKWVAFVGAISLIVALTLAVTR